MAIFRYIAMNRLRSTKTKSSLKVRRIRPAGNTRYLDAILKGER